MAAKQHSVPIEEALMKELRFGGIAKENLEELVRIAAEIHKVGMKRIKVFPKGIPPVVDGLRVSGIVDSGEINNVLSKILASTARLSGVIVFPYGIPWPDIYRVSVDIGPTVEAGAINQF